MDEEAVRGAGSDQRMGRKREREREREKGKERERERENWLEARECGRRVGEKGMRCMWLL